jgi:hypothetical protein
MRHAEFQPLSGRHEDNNRGTFSSGRGLPFYDKTV